MCIFCRFEMSHSCFLCTLLIELILFVVFRRPQRRREYDVSGLQWRSTGGRQTNAAASFATRDGGGSASAEILAKSSPRWSQRALSHPSPPGQICLPSRGGRLQSEGMAGRAQEPLAWSSHQIRPRLGSLGKRTASSQ